MKVPSEYQLEFLAMGGMVSKVRGHFVTRPLQRYNAETRAEKVISQEKPSVAPKYRSDEELLSQMRQTHPEVLAAAHKRNPELLDRLKQVYVTSEDVGNFDPDSLKQIEDPKKPHPKKENQVKHVLLREQDYLKSIFDDENIKPKPGTVTLAQAQEIINKHAFDCQKNNLEVLAEEYDVKPRQIEDLVRHFSVFTLYKSENMDDITDDGLTPDPSWEDTRHPTLETPKIIESSKVSSMAQMKLLETTPRRSN